MGKVRSTIIAVCATMAVAVAVFANVQRNKARDAVEATRALTAFDTLPVDTVHDEDWEPVEWFWTTQAYYPPLFDSVQVIGWYGDSTYVYRYTIAGPGSADTLWWSGVWTLRERDR